MIVMTAVMTQAPISSAGDAVTRAISAETIKMPEPIMDPTTIDVALKRPSPLTSGSCVVEGLVAGADAVTLQVVLPEKR